MNWYLKVVRDNYANFEGRARRQEYWMFTLFQMVIVFIIVLISTMIVGVSESLWSMSLIYIYLFATALPSIAVSVRRLHDTGKSGWLYLIAFIPYIGGLILLVFMIIEGDKGPNKYGADPKTTFDEIEEIGKTLEN